MAKKPYADKFTQAMSQPLDAVDRLRLFHTDPATFSPIDLDDAAAILQKIDALMIEVDKIEAMLAEGQGEDCGLQILPDFTEGMTTSAKVEACLDLLEMRRDVIEATFSAAAGG